MEKGLQSQYNERELDLLGMQVEAEHFDFFEHCDTESYLSQLLIRAHSLNMPFQNDIMNIFDIDESEDNGRNNNLQLLYQGAPVKLAPRIKIKSQTDYADQKFPQTACVLDVIRCSLCFDDCHALLVGLKRFEKMIKERRKLQLKNESSGNRNKKGGGGSINDGCIKSIVRVKNMFSKLNKKLLETEKKDDNINLLNKFQYCDIKYNVIVLHNGMALVGEVQFLLNWMLVAKQMLSWEFGYVIVDNVWVFSMCLFVCLCFTVDVYCLQGT